MPDTMPWEDFGGGVAAKEAGPWNDFSTPKIKKTREQVISEVQKAQAAHPEESLGVLGSVGNALYWPTRIASRLDPITAITDAMSVGTGGNQFQALALPPEVAQKAVEFFSPGGVAPEGTVGRGVQNFSSQLLSGLTSPHAVAGLMSGKVNPVLPAVTFAPPMVSDAPQATQDLYASQGGQQTTENLLRLLMNVLGPVGIARGASAEMQPKLSGLGYSEIPGVKVQDLPGQEGVLGPERQIPQNTYQAPSLPQPGGGARFVTDPLGNVSEMLGLSPQEQINALREFSTPRPTRPSQASPQTIEINPEVQTETMRLFRQAPQIEPQTVPFRAPVEPSGGEISFRSPAAAEGIPNAQQQAQPQIPIEQRGPSGGNLSSFGPFDPAVFRQMAKDVGDLTKFTKEMIDKYGPDAANAIREGVRQARVAALQQQKEGEPNASGLRIIEEKANEQGNVGGGGGGSLSGNPQRLGEQESVGGIRNPELGQEEVSLPAKKPEVINLGEGFRAEIDPNTADASYYDSRGTRVGRLKTSETPDGMIVVENHTIDNEARGVGRGQQVIQRLSEITGKPIVSDQYPSTAARSMWERLGAKREKVKLGDEEQVRYVLSPKTLEARTVKPEVVKLGGSKIKGPLGDPLGTTYRSTPEDYSAYQKAQADLKQLTQEDPHMEKPGSMQRYQEIMGRNEVVKNKYGGMPPEAPLSKSTSKAIDWDLFHEDLVGDLDSFSPARDTGKIDYDLQDMAQRFVEYAKKDNTGKPPSDLVKDFSKVDEATPSQISKLRQSVKNVAPPIENRGPIGGNLSTFGFLDPAVYKKTAKDLSDLVKSGATREKISAFTDAVENQAKVAARQIGNRIRVALPVKLDRQALTFLVEAGGDKNKLKEFLSQASGNAKARLSINHAIANFNRLQPHATEAARLIEQQRQMEVANGIDAGEAPNYIKHSYEESEKNVFFDPGAGGSGVSTGFKKQRTFSTYAEAIKAGLTPQTLDAADLIESRTAAGQKLINRIKWGEALADLKDPSSGQPIVQPLIKQTPKGTIVAPKGYQHFEVLPGISVAVKNDYAGLLDALTGQSAIRSSVVGRALLKTEAGIKHGLLLVDTFHASRMMQKQLFLTGKVGFEKGLSLLEYDQPTLNRMVKSGDITPEIRDWANANRADLQMGLKNGLNVGRLTEALYSEIVRKELPVMGVDVNLPGRFNKWVFDKLTRGVMVQSYLIELERAQKNHPEWSRDEASSYAAKQINVYYGNLGRQGVFKSSTMQDALRLAFLAPQWVEGMVQTEARAYKQAAEVPVDAALNKTLRVGTAAKGVGTGLLSYVIATQLLNKFTTGHLTNENEEGHKMDAFIPDPTHKSGGYWISPFSVAAEVTHDWLRYSHNMSQPKVLAQILGNKASPLARSVKTLLLGTDFTGTKLLEENRMKEAGKALIPIPLPASGLTSDRPGQTGRQIFGSLGLKVEMAQQKGAKQDEIAKEKFGKPFEQLSPRERIKTSRELKGEVDQNLQQKYASSQRATESEFETRSELQKSLPKNVQDYLKEKKVEVSGYENFKKVGGSSINLSSGERDRLKELMKEEYSTSLSRMVVRPKAMEDTPQQAEVRVRVFLEQARAKAWSRMMKEIKGKSGAGAMQSPELGK